MEGISKHRHRYVALIICFYDWDSCGPVYALRSKSAHHWILGITTHAWPFHLRLEKLGYGVATRISCGFSHRPKESLIEDVVHFFDYKDLEWLLGAKRFGMFAFCCMSYQQIIDSHIRMVYIVGASNYPGSSTPAAGDAVTVLTDPHSPHKPDGASCRSCRLPRLGFNTFGLDND